MMGEKAGQDTRPLTAEIVERGRTMVAQGWRIVDAARELRVNYGIFYNAMRGGWPQVKAPPIEKMDPKPVYTCQACGIQYRTSEGGTRHHCGYCLYLIRSGPSTRRDTLSDVVVRLIRRLYHEDDWKIAEIAALLNCNQSVVYHAAAWHTYKNSGGPGRPKHLKPLARCRRCEMRLYTKNTLCPTCREEIKSLPKRGRGRKH